MTLANREDNNLEDFYESWSSKTVEDIALDIDASVRKADILASGIPEGLQREIRTILDFGCGYGGLANRMAQRLAVHKAIGVDFSAIAINEACRRFGSETLHFHKLPSLDSAETAIFLNALIPEGVDCILLIDLLEHVPDCRNLVAHLAPFTKFFVIKLPIESSVIDNYVLPKEYPSSKHSNGHLREFDANNVHYFIRQLGLTPLHEFLYVYHIDDIFPPMPPTTVSFKRIVIRAILRGFKRIAALLLPTKAFLRLIGGGGYVCIVTYDPAHVLIP